MFKPDPSDEGELSTTWEALAPVGKVLEVAFGIPHAAGRFGLCAVSIDAVLVEAGNAVRLILKPDPEDWLLGAAHVVVTNCDESIQAILTRHAVVVQPPAGPEIR